MSAHVIRASFTEKTVRVYQAYRPEIAIPALNAGRFVPPFKMGRMTWIKPSFNWMMYRSGYATKPGQEFILGIDIQREGFDWALEHATLSNFNTAAHDSPEEWKRLLAMSPVRIQWDPERDSQLNVIEGIRAVQIGLSGEAVERYVMKWITKIEDMTPAAHQLSEAIKSGRIPKSIPSEHERPYPTDQGYLKSLLVGH